MRLFPQPPFRITITLFSARDIVGLKNIGSVYVLYLVAGFCAAPFWVSLSNCIGKHRALAVAFVLVATTGLLLLLVQPEQTELFLALFMAPALLLLTSIWMLLRYPLTAPASEAARRARSPRGRRPAARKG